MQYHHISVLQTEVPMRYYRRHEYSQDLIQQPPAEYEVNFYTFISGWKAIAFYKVLCEFYSPRIFQTRIVEFYKVSTIALE